MSRDEEITKIFEGTLVALSRVLSRLALSHEEEEDFQETVFLWFDRFTRRPGNERVAIEQFQISLLSAACKLAQDFSCRKGIQVRGLTTDPVHLAQELGLVDGPEKETRA